MPQFRDEDGVIWEGTGPDDPNLREVPQGGAGGGVVLPAAPEKPERPPARTAAGAVTEGLPQGMAWVDPNDPSKGAVPIAGGKDAKAEARKELNRAFNTDNVLAAIRQARRIAQSDGGVAWESLLKGIPATDARRLKGELDTISGNLSFDGLKGIREESATGAGVGSVTERELELLGSLVASLDQGADLQSFLDRLDRIERNFIQVQVAAQGIDPESPEGRRAFKQDYGYTGVFEDENKRQETTLGGADGTTTEAIPPEYQATLTRYLRDNWGNVDPRDYAALRVNLDQQYGLSGNTPADYAGDAPRFNDYAAKGGTADQIPALPGIERELSGFEQGLNSFTQSPGGTAFANASNALLGGIPARLGGGQENLELLREANPKSAFVGELAGNIGGTFIAGGVGGKLLPLLGRPLAAETTYGAIYGATQDDDPLRGAATGGAFSLGGGFLGNKIGQALPDTFASGAMREAEAGIPTVDELKTLAGQQYQEVQSRGVAAGGDDTLRLAENLGRTLRRDGRIDADGKLIDENTPITKGYGLINSFAGKEMTPVQAGSVRDVLSEGRGVGTPNERRIAGNLVRDFDEWADPVLPGIDVPRGTAQRYLQGQAIQQRTGIGTIRGQRAKGNDVGDSIRTQFGQLDEAIERGDEYFEPATREAIATAARGDGLTNGLRAAGKFGLGNPLTAGGIGIGGGAAFMGAADPLYAGVALTAGALGTAARRLAEQRTLRAAKDAELTALGTPEQLELLELARRQAGVNAGRLFGSTLGVGGSMATRQPQPLPR